MKLEIQVVGNPKFRRYIIANDHGEVFDGSSFTKDRDRAVLYAEGQAVAVQHNLLQEAMFDQYPLREFTVPLNIRVRAAGRYSQKQLEEYLERAVSILIDQDRCGTGPVEDCMVQLAVTWAEVKEKAVIRDKDEQ